MSCYCSANRSIHPSWRVPLHRRLAYDDFIAVAEDLIRRQVTSPAKLGIRGGSNGGLLMGNMMVSASESDPSWRLMSMSFHLWSLDRCVVQICSQQCAARCLCWT